MQCFYKCLSTGGEGGWGRGVIQYRQLPPLLYRPAIEGASYRTPYTIYHTQGGGCSTRDPLYIVGLHTV